MGGKNPSPLRGRVKLRRQSRECVFEVICSEIRTGFIPLFFSLSSAAPGFIPLSHLCAWGGWLPSRHKKPVRAAVFLSLSQQHSTLGASC